MIGKSEAENFLNRNIAVVHTDDGFVYSNVGRLTNVTENGLLLDGQLGRVFISFAGISKIREVPSA